MTSDYWQSESKVKKINQITTASPLAVSRKSRKTETLLDVGGDPTCFQSPTSQRNRQFVNFRHRRLKVVAMRNQQPQNS